MNEFSPASHIIQDVRPFLKELWPETYYFLQAGAFLKRKRRMKQALVITAFDKNLVQNDYKITVYNGCKSFFEYNTGLLKYRYGASRKLPFTAFGRIKRSIMFRYNELLYMTHRFKKFSNLIFTMQHSQSWLININTYAKPLNKIMFFNIIKNLKRFSLYDPVLIMYRYRKFKRLRFYYLGLKISFKRKPLKRLNSILRKTRLLQRRYKRNKLFANKFIFRGKRYKIKKVTFIKRTRKLLIKTKKKESLKRILLERKKSLFRNRKTRKKSI